MGRSEENEQCPNVFVQSQWIHNVLSSKEVREFLLDV